VGGPGAGQPAGDLEAGRQHRDGDAGAAERPGRHLGAAGLALVEDHRGGGPGPLGVVDLGAEGAGAALERSDRAPGEAGGVGRLAAAGGAVGARARGEPQVDEVERGGDVAAAGELEGAPVAAGLRGDAGQLQHRAAPFPEPAGLEPLHLGR
jgi:hypothetical protein